MLRLAKRIHEVRVAPNSLERTRPQRAILLNGCWPGFSARNRYWPGIHDAMMLTIRPMSEQDAEKIATWRYPAPYSMYDLTKNEIPVLLNAENWYFSVHDGTGRLMGFCCFGKEARVPGGEYAGSGSKVLDVGLGMNPEKVGKGLGEVFIGAILAFALEEFQPVKFRVSIAEFNKRSQSAFESQGFKEVARFKKGGVGMKFVQLERDSILGRQISRLTTR